MHNTGEAAGHLEPALELTKVPLGALSEHVTTNQGTDMLRELLPCRSTESESQPRVWGRGLGLPECQRNN